MATSPATSNLTSTVHHSGYPFSSTSCSSRRMYDHTRINPHISSVVNSLSANSPLSSSPFHSWAPSASSFSSSSSSSSRIFAMPSDHNYSTLGVPVGASEEQIKKARRKLALKVIYNRQTDHRERYLIEIQQFSFLSFFFSFQLQTAMASSSENADRQFSR